jgi:hypothetical protein
MNGPDRTKSFGFLAHFIKWVVTIISFTQLRGESSVFIFDIRLILCFLIIWYCGGRAFICIIQITFLMQFNFQVLVLLNLFLFCSRAEQAVGGFKNPDIRVISFVVFFLYYYLSSIFVAVEVLA